MAGYNVVFGPNNLPFDFIDQNGNYKKNNTGVDIIVEHDGDYYTIPACSDNYLLCWYGNGGQNLINTIGRTNIDFKNINNGEFVASVDADDFDIETSYSGTCLTAAFGSKPNGSIHFVENMFENCDITELCLPSCYTSEIPSRCFYNSLLIKINLEDIDTIGNLAFANCSLLTFIEFPSSVTTIGDTAFENSGLNNSIIIPNTVTSIGDGVFKNCSYLQSATVNNSDIGENQFEGCSSLNTVTLNNSILLIPAKSFLNCSNLISITNLTNVTDIENYAFSGCSNLTTINLSNVNNVGNYSFDGCSSLTNINLSNVTTIDNYAFNNCSGLTSIDLPNVQTINYSCFVGCTGLTSIKLGSQLTSVGLNAFHILQSSPVTLQEVEILATTPPRFIGSQGLLFNNDIYSNTILKVPSGSITSYQNDSEWGLFLNIQGI